MYTFNPDHLKWEDSLLIWATPSAGSLYKGQGRRKLALFGPAFSLSYWQVPSFTGLRAYFLGILSGGAELNTVLAEGGGTFPLDPDLEAKCDSSAVTARSRCVSGAAVRLSFCRGSPSSSAHQEDYDGNKRKILEIPLN